MYHIFELIKINESRENINNGLHWEKFYHLKSRAGTKIWGGHGFFVFFCFFIAKMFLNGFQVYFTSRKHLRTKVTPDFHLTYSKNGGNLGSESK